MGGFHCFEFDELRCEYLPIRTSSASLNDGGFRLEPACEKQLAQKSNTAARGHKLLLVERE
jgi:hypothetical protein